MLQRRCFGMCGLVFWLNCSKQEQLVFIFKNTQFLLFVTNVQLTVSISRSHKYFSDEVKVNRRQNDVA